MLFLRTGLRLLKSNQSIMKRNIAPGDLPGFFPCPVVLLSSFNAEGRPNVCTVSWIGVVCSEPPSLGVGLRRERLSYKNITRIGGFVINIPSRDLLDVVDSCGYISGTAVDKLEKYGLSYSVGSVVNGPVITECPYNLECSVRTSYELGSHDLLIAEIVCIHAEGSIVKDGADYPRIDFSIIKPVLLCVDEYWAIGDYLNNIGFSIETNR